MAVDDTLKLNLQHQPSGTLRPAEDISPAAQSILHAQNPFYLVVGGLLIGIVITVLLSLYISQSRLLEKQNLLPRTVSYSTQQRNETSLAALQEIIKQPFHILLIFVPLGWFAYWAQWGQVACFWLNLVAMLPLASILGEATEELSGHFGSVIGGLINASFGNVVELMIVVQSLKLGLINVTKGSLLGSILSNELLVLGAALLLGGLFEKNGKFRPVGRMQAFTPSAASAQCNILLFSVAVFAVPSIFSHQHGVSAGHVLNLSRAGAVFALLTYGVYLLFTLWTHASILRGDGDDEEPRLTRMHAALLLVASTVLVAISTEYLVHSVDGFSKALGLSETFIGVVVLPIVGNACEHSTAVIFAMKDNVDLAIGIALGSAVQISLLVIPFAVFCGWVLGIPMDLDFDEVNSWALVLSAILVCSVLQSGVSQWLSGFLLIATYALLAALFFFQTDHHIGVNRS
jgi:Ca2+:H+ antiporter